MAFERLCIPARGVTRHGSAEVGRGVTRHGSAEVGIGLQSVAHVPSRYAALLAPLVNGSAEVGIGIQSRRRDALGAHRISGAEH